MKLSVAEYKIPKVRVHTLPLTRNWLRLPKLNILDITNAKMLHKATEAPRIVAG